MQETPLLISSLIEYAERYHGDTEIVSSTVEGGIHRTNYRELGARSRKLASALCKLGVEKGERIATLAWNTYRHIELYYAVSGLGAVLHTVNPRLFPEQIEYILNHAEDTTLCFDATFLPLLKKIAPQCRTLRRCVLLADETRTQAMRAELPGIELVSYETLLSQGGDDYAWPQLEESTASSLCYTSGTTGNPKGVLYSHRSTVLHSFAVCAADGMALSSKSSVLVIVPLFHANAWGVPYAAAMCGAKLVLPGPALDGESVCRLLTNESVDLSLGVPTVWMAFLTYLDKNPERRPQALKRVVIGGSAASPALISRFEEGLDIEVLHLWGMTEMSPLGTYGTPPHRLRDISKAERIRLKHKQGRAAYGVDLKIVDDSGSELPRDGKAFGVLKVRGPWIARRYFRDEGGEILDEAGYFATGDVATLDGDGYMQITDRAKDVIKSGGEWISSIDLENAAVAHPAIAEAAVIGVAHPHWQERPLLIAVKKPGSEITGLELLLFLTEKVAKWWLPDDIVFVTELPHTATGKLNKLALRERFRDHKLPTVSTPPSPST